MYSYNVRHHFSHFHLPSVERVVFMRLICVISRNLVVPEYSLALTHTSTVPAKENFVGYILIQITSSTAGARDKGEVERA